jgi:hypothetical protein
MEAANAQTAELRVLFMQRIETLLRLVNDYLFTGSLPMT